MLEISRKLCDLINYIWFLYYTYIYGEYPFGYLVTLDKSVISYPLIRRTDIQENYHEQNLERKRVYINKIRETVSIDNTYFVKNDYPYNVPWYVKHYILWIRSGLTMNDEALTLAIKSHILAEFGSHLKFVFFKNANKNKSITEIEHYHVFIMNTF